MKTTVATILLFIFSFFIYPNRAVANWVEIGNSVFFDPSNIEFTDHGTILVWFNEILDQGIIYSRLLKHDNYYMKGYNYSDYLYSIEQFEYDCKNKLMRLTIEYDYDDDNKVIFRTYDFNSSFTPVATTNPENELRFNEVCNFAINNQYNYGLYQQHHRPLPRVMNPRPTK